MTCASDRFHAPTRAGPTSGRFRPAGRLRLPVLPPRITWTAIIVRMGRLLLITGPPGAGKSTVARIVADRAKRSVLVSGDTFFGFLARGAIQPWLAESNEQNEIVTRAAASAASTYAASGYSTVYDGVVGPWFLPVFLSATTLEQLDYVILLPDVESCVRRVETRRGHGLSAPLSNVPRAEPAGPECRRRRNEWPAFGVDAGARDTCPRRALSPPPQTMFSAGRPSCGGLRLSGHNSFNRRPVQASALNC